MGGLLALFYNNHYYYYHHPHPCGRIFMEWIFTFFAIALWTRILERIKSCALISSGGVSRSNSLRGGHLRV